MLVCNTELYDDVDKKWQWDRVINLSATCYIKFSKSHYSYIQPMAHINDRSFGHPEKDEITIPTANVYSSPEILGGIFKNHPLLQFSYVLNFRSRQKYVLNYPFFEARRK